MAFSTAAVARATGLVFLIVSVTCGLWGIVLATSATCLYASTNFGSSQGLAPSGSSFCGRRPVLMVLIFLSDFRMFLITYTASVFVGCYLWGVFGIIIYLSERDRQHFGGLSHGKDSGTQA